jgi:hypothetical protein
MSLVLRHRRDVHPRLVIDDGGDSLGIADDGIFPPDKPTLTENVSLASPMRSPFTSTAIVFEVSPAANVTVPDAD